MGACPSGEYFHEEIHNIIRQIPNCANISDNIWLWSNNMTQHLEDLDNLLTTLETSGLTLREEKCSFAVTKINVFGHIVSRNGIQPDEAKINAVNCHSPSTEVCNGSRFNVSFCKETALTEMPNTLDSIIYSYILKTVVLLRNATIYAG